MLVILRAWGRANGVRKAVLTMLSKRRSADVMQKIPRRIAAKLRVSRTGRRAANHAALHDFGNPPLTRSP
ncbi:hypothetical protein ACMA5I_13530 [Paracoccaceae bacterium GXU_MW_L88]